MSSTTEPGPDESTRQDRSLEPAPTRIASSLAALDRIAERPLAEHADVFSRVHAELQDALAEIDGG